MRAANMFAGATALVASLALLDGGAAGAATPAAIANASSRQITPAQMDGVDPAAVAAIRDRMAARRQGLNVDERDADMRGPPNAALTTDMPERGVTLSSGSGRLIRLPRPVSNIFIADDKIADVQMKSANQFYLFAKGPGSTTIYATDRAGAVIWSTDVRVGNNITQVGSLLRQMMPENDVRATPIGGMILLSGTVLSPKDADEAQRLAEAFVGAGVTVINHLKIATPQQVNLHVKIAEVSREFVKNIGVNIMSRDTTNGFVFGIAQGRQIGSASTVNTSIYPTADVSSFYGLPAGSVSAPFNLATGRPVIPGQGSQYDLSGLAQGAGKTALAFAGKFWGLDLISALDLAETDGLVTTLAEPNLTALSGETASFLAGGEIPIPISQGLGAVSVSFKSYGINLTFTPTVMSAGRIILKVAPEVSQITAAGAVTVNGFSVPALSTRRAETTVELGSGQSFMIGGLLSNNANNSTDRVPGLGNLPVIGALFRSNSFRKQQTELVIVVTPYIVRPVDSSAITLPTDGYKAPTDLERVLLGRTVGKTKTIPTSPGATAVNPPSAGGQ